MCIQGVNVDKASPVGIQHPVLFRFLGSYTLQQLPAPRFGLWHRVYLLFHPLLEPVDHVSGVHHESLYVLPNQVLDPVSPY
jgi:hypothetical protein